MRGRGDGEQGVPVGQGSGEADEVRQAAYLQGYPQRSAQGVRRQ